MMCQKCKNTGVLNTVNGQDFWYCRACKEEIMLDIVDVPTWMEELSDKDFLELSKLIKKLNDYPND